ncbi:hypothetical protein FE257_002015 [Aspergillus nanangensis]|uniref:Alpha-L-rhamnosidase six-hairpin glycosidase domain-containing protein n=1 Tax=Aspergillus nanangensis TaxID=2582783 RepID=A0AAD4CTP0_ASPNN|nr:hypothetical protein FE257_002015 [Aspergillus nanangensis]
MALPPPEDMKESTTETRWNRRFEQAANTLQPTLHRWTRLPQRLVEFETGCDQYFGVSPRTSNHSISDLPSLNWTKDGELVLDFGIHMVGYLSFHLNFTGANMDAPCRLQLTFGESPFDVTMDMNNVNTWLSTSWLPDEVINIDICPTTVSLPRRYSFRYLKIRVIDASPKYQIRFSEIRCDCVSAVSQDTLVESFQYTDPALQAIDHVSISTLRDCMQSVFEDGPRRDRRLWIGDLRLQALTSYSTFRDYTLVKRCLYLFAAVSRVDGSLPGCVFVQPTLSPSTDYILDYDMLFGAIVLDYVSASHDTDTGHDLYPTVLGSLNRALAHLDPDTHTFNPSHSTDWKFLDWDSRLDRTAGEHGVLLYALNATNKLATLLQKPQPHAQLAAQLTAAAACFLAPECVFISGPDSQVSYASAAWLVLAEAFPPETARRALLNTLSHRDAIKPLTPYLWHHVCDALAQVGCYKECVDLVTRYWGGMVEAGADTFWECFDAEDAKASPYGDVRNNSFCHAWSCTPSYLLRGKLREFVGAKRIGDVRMAEWDELWIRRSMMDECT